MDVIKEGLLDILARAQAVRIPNHDHVVTGVVDQTHMGNKGGMVPQHLSTTILYLILSWS